MSGTQILKNLKATDPTAVEDKMESLVYSGQVPQFLKDFETIETNCDGQNVKFRVAADYLSLGTDKNYFRLKLGARRAQRLADRLGFVLPTAAMVQIIHATAVAQGNSIPGKGMRNLQGVCFGDTGMQTLDCLEFYETQVISPRMKKINLGNLVSGFKKDIVVPPSTRPADRVSIFGFSTNNVDFPIQDGFGPHPQWYSDYSHAIRFVDPNIEVDGQRMTMEEAISAGKANCLFKNWLGSVTEMQAVYPVQSVQGKKCRN